MKRVKSARRLQRFVSIHDPIANLLNDPRCDIPPTTIANCEQQQRKYGAQSHAWPKADDLDELLEPFVFIFFFDIGDMEADGALSGSRHSVVTQVCDAGSRAVVKRLVVND